MDYEKLIERLYQHNKNYGEGRTQDFFRVCLDCKDAATAIETLRAENRRLNEVICSIPTEPDSGRTIGQYDKEMSMCAYLDDLEAENKSLRADLARVTAERDAIERDFRAFTKQWWEEANGFPCRFCKFENSGGCEWKAKHPNDEKPCAGRWFEWRGIKKED